MTLNLWYSSNIKVRIWQSAHIQLSHKIIPGAQKAPLLLLCSCFPNISLLSNHNNHWAEPQQPWREKKRTILGHSEHTYLTNVPHKSGRWQWQFQAPAERWGPVSGLPHLAMFLLVTAWSSTSFANERSTRCREHPRNILSARTYTTYLLRSYPVSGSSDHWFQRTIISVMPWKVFGGCQDPAREVIQWNTSAWYQQGFSRSPVSGHVRSSSLQWEKMTWARNSLNHWNRQWEEFPSVLEMAIEEAS